MKKLLVALLVIGLIVAVNVNVASANGGPHGGYAATTDECARCHRAHSGQSANLLAGTTGGTALCLTCHGAAATGANTDVEDGVWEGAREADQTGDGSTEGGTLVAGGFVNVGGTAVTSTHTLGAVDIGIWTLVAADGSNTNAVSTQTGGLSCDDCHDPHGNANYRMVNTAVTDYDSASKSYTIEAWDLTGGNTSLSSMCASCHTNYHQTAAASGDNLGQFFTHRVDVLWDGDGTTAGDIGFGAADNPETGAGLKLPLASDTAPNTTMLCSTCHYSHGSAAAMGTYSTAAASAEDSALLRLDNRGTCQVCHDK